VTIAAEPDTETVQQTREIPTDSVIFRQDLYPRIETDPATVQKYADCLDVLPPIEVNQESQIIDGWHRWTAHRKVGAKTIKVVVTRTESDSDLLELAIERNAAHGLQLSQEDKRDMARRIYNSTPDKERDDKKKHLARILSVPERTLRDWLSRIDKDAKATRDKRIFDLWLACWTQEQIAEREGVSQPLLADMTKNFISGGSLADSDKAAASHATDFEVPLYNVWKQQEKTKGSAHFGNSEVRWLDNLLYLYTKPFDVVVDPFSGGGSTIDICRKRFRRYWASDRKPIVERDDQIRAHDLTSGLPSVPRWKEVSLVYLDPPYWKQAQGQYSNDPTDLANMPLEQFTETLAGIINAFGKKLSCGVVALLIQPTQWNAPERAYTDHVADMLRRVKLTLDMRISCPYESQQCNAQMVEWAKANRRVLVLTRELLVWKA
jgi:hypothetical protein